MSHNYCTLFNIDFAANGVALYQSLIRHDEDAQLFVLCMDEVTFSFLETLGLPGMTAVPLQQFLIPELEQTRGSRSIAEFCWTCTPLFLRYCIETYALDHCTYLDSDLYFFRFPAGYDQLRSSYSVLITEHHFAPAYDDAGKYGKYCVQFVYFDTAEGSLNLLNQWCQQCLEWCYDRIEADRFGDQKYLDPWPINHAFVGVIADTNYGIAPWNLTRFPEANPVFFHFHNVKYVRGKFDMKKACIYEIPYRTMRDFYVPYIRELNAICKTHGILSQRHGGRAPNALEFAVKYKSIIAYRTIRFRVKRGYRKIKNFFRR